LALSYGMLLINKNRNLQVSIPSSESSKKQAESLTQLTAPGSARGHIYVSTLTRL
jgi:hypothetical protein